MTPEERRAHLENARELFNRGEYWLAHEALETVWRSIIKESDEAGGWQGLIQAAAAMLHRQRGNRPGIVKPGAAALAKLGGAQRPAIEVGTGTCPGQAGPGPGGRRRRAAARVPWRRGRTEDG